MKNSALALTKPVETMITVMSGPAKGTVYRLVSGRVTIGRGPDNDIVIVDDPKCSRNHAQIMITGTGPEIQDLTNRNYISVNGNECKRAPLGDNSIFVLGDTQFRFSLRSPGAAVPAPMGAGGTSPMAMAPLAGTSANLRPLRRKESSSPIFWILVAIVAGIVWVGVTQRGKKPITAQLEPDSGQQQIDIANRLKQDAESRRPKDVPLSDVGYNQAQQSFVSGFRDYQKGQYDRALASFRACENLYPQHGLCGRYARLAERRLDEMIQYHMVVGQKYRDQQQYRACESAFRNVMILIRDESNKRYREAKVNWEACKAQLEERF